jgi:anti-anti-sigma factor
MDVWLSENHRVAVVTASGDLDMCREDELRSALMTAASATHQVVLDFARVAFIDSHSIGIIVAAQRRMRADGGDLTVVHVPRGLRRVFVILGLDFLLSPDTELLSNFLS